MNKCPKCKSDKWVFVHEGFMCHGCETVIPDALGVQIAHIPPEAENSLYHPSVEFGFITNIAVDLGLVWARMWLPAEFLDYGTPIFRTKSPEMLPISEITLFERFPKKFVDEEMAKMASDSNNLN